jgi:pantoate--beta-alanine ligase
MIILRTAQEVRDQVSALHRKGKTIALVPTMGSLHEGHLFLLREGKKLADICAASIFVNPTQFGPSEDFSRYPRDEEGDLKKCAEAGVDLVWVPPVAEVYAFGDQTSVEVLGLSKMWCGITRPSHFRGVTTVVAKFLAIFRPNIALFGEKDFQQLKVIERMNRDLGFGAQIVGMPIVREPDGLAMSSRNAYLTTDERCRALCLFQALEAAVKLRSKGENNAALLRKAALAELDRAHAKIDYVAIVDANTLELLEQIVGPARLLIAAYIGKTRLIDNIAL